MKISIPTFFLMLILISCTRDKNLEILKSNCKLVKHYYDSENRIISEYGEYCNGKKIGKWTEWYRNGKIKWEGYY